MIRFVVIALLAVLVWFVLLTLFRAIRTRGLDWSGIAFAIAFIALAFYLRHVTGMG